MPGAALVEHPVRVAFSDTVLLAIAPVLSVAVQLALDHSSHEPLPRGESFAGRPAFGNGQRYRQEHGVALTVRDVHRDASQQQRHPNRRSDARCPPRHEHEHEHEHHSIA